MYNDLQPTISIFAQIISHLSSGDRSFTSNSSLIKWSLTAMRTPPPCWPFLSLLNMRKPSGNISLFLIPGSSQVSLPIIMSGLVLSMIFLTRCCLRLMDWKLIFSTRSGVLDFDVTVFFCLGVDWCDGLKMFVGDFKLFSSMPDRWFKLSNGFGVMLVLCKS